MVRTQIQLTEQQMEALRRCSLRKKQSLAELIRQSVDLFLGLENQSPREMQRKRAREAAGRFASGSSDVSGEHDRYLADAFGS
jgi:hypothetical protein